MPPLDAVFADIRRKYADPQRRDRPASRGFAGCTESEIEEIRKDQQVAFVPEPFRRFLARFGREAGGFLVGTDAFYPRLLGVKEGAVDCLADNGEDWTLGADSLVISMHQGYYFDWFPSIERPEVYSYREGRGIVGKQSDFVGYLRQLV